MTVEINMTVKIKLICECTKEKMVKTKQQQTTNKPVAVHSSQRQFFYTFYITQNLDVDLNKYFRY